MRKRRTRHTAGSLLAGTLLSGLVLGCAAVTPPPLPSAPPPAATLPETVRVTRPLTPLERGLIAVATIPPAVTWGAGGAAAGGLLTLAACLHDSRGSASDALSGCPIGAGLVIGEVVGVFAGATRGAAGAARRVGCESRESRRRAFRGALAGTLWGVAPAALYVVAGGRSAIVVEAAVAVIAPVLQIVGAARGAGRCRVSVPILR